MKTFLKLTIGLTLILYSCNSEAPFESEFEKSIDIWTTQKKNTGDSYAYTIRRTSVFGFGSNTKITVINGKVVAREYEAFTFDHQTQESETTNSWAENESELNTHAEGAKPLTIDELYGICKNELLAVNEDDNTIYFSAEHDGIISSCGHVPKNCADDCFIGFDIVAFEWLN